MDMHSILSSLRNLCEEEKGSPGLLRKMARGPLGKKIDALPHRVDLKGPTRGPWYELFMLAMREMAKFSRGRESYFGDVNKYAEIGGMILVILFPEEDERRYKITLHYRDQDKADDLIKVLKHVISRSKHLSNSAVLVSFHTPPVFSTDLGEKLKDFGGQVIPVPLSGWVIVDVSDIDGLIKFMKSTELMANLVTADGKQSFFDGEGEG